VDARARLRRRETAAERSGEEQHANPSGTAPRGFGFFNYSESLVNHPSAEPAAARARRRRMQSVAGGALARRPESLGGPRTCGG
jgi:hypothetical protein